MDPLTNPVRHYAWGSHVALAAIQGRPAPTREPEAELWMGAHADASSRLTRGGAQRDLAACIAHGPDGELGAAVLSRFGARLPFLLKLLAADRPLSLQVHPSTEQAAAGDWPDPWGKPELLCAVTPFEALCGLRAPEEVLRLLLPLELPEVAARVGRDAPGEVVAWLLRAPPEEVATMTDRLRRTARREAARPGPDRRHYDHVARLAAEHPGDPGVLVALLMHHVVLEPGEAVFLGPGTPHSYLRGVGVEIMGSSDNVVRGGLTRKEVDTERFLEVLDGRAGAAPVLQPSEVAPGVDTYPAPAKEFRLRRIRLDGRLRLVAHGPQVLFSLWGEASLSCGGDALTLRGGEAVYAGADNGPVTLEGEAVMFLATPGVESTPVHCEPLGYWGGELPRSGHRRPPEAQRSRAGARGGAAARHG